MFLSDKTLAEIVIAEIVVKIELKKGDVGRRSRHGRKAGKEDKSNKAKISSKDRRVFRKLPVFTLE